jgi:tetratricopeptide (TPR) repeat protein
MHNIHNLEQRWVKFKIKQFLPYIITIVFSAILIVTLFFIINSKSQNDSNITNKEAKVVQEKNEVKVTKNKIPEQNISDKKETIIVEEKVIVEEKPKKDEKIILSPSMDFMKKLRTDSIMSYESQENNSYTQDDSTNDTSNNPVEVVQQTQPKENFEEEVTQKRPQINISRKQDRSDIEDVIKRFKKNNNPALSLFVAKKYYQLGEYQKAYNYALVTNEINNEIEQSWLIFAKSLVKLNKRQKAIQTLTKYVKHSGSGNAKVLLDDIKSGKFR